MRAACLPRAPFYSVPPPSPCAKLSACSSARQPAARQAHTAYSHSPAPQPPHPPRRPPTRPPTHTRPPTRVAADAPHKQRLLLRRPRHAVHLVPRRLHCILQGIDPPLQRLHLRSGGSRRQAAVPLTRAVPAAPGWAQLARGKACDWSATPLAWESSRRLKAGTARGHPRSSAEHHRRAALHLPRNQLAGAHPMGPTPPPPCPPAGSSCTWRQRPAARPAAPQRRQRRCPPPCAAGGRKEWRPGKVRQGQARAPLLNAASSRLPHTFAFTCIARCHRGVGSAAPQGLPCLAPARPPARCPPAHLPGRLHMRVEQRHNLAAGRALPELAAGGRRARLGGAAGPRRRQLAEVGADALAGRPARAAGRLLFAACHSAQHRAARTQRQRSGSRRGLGTQEGH